MAKRSSFDIFREILSQNLLNTPDYSKMVAPKPADVKTDFAQYLLTHSFKGPKVIGADLAAREGAKTEEPGLLSKIFDTMSAPLYGATNLITGQAENVKNVLGDVGILPDDNTEGLGKDVLDLFTEGPESIIGATAQGLHSGAQLPGGAPVANLLEGPAGKLGDKWAPKKTGADVLGSMGVKNPVAKYGGGFAFDMLADPLTYVPGLNVVSGARKAEKAVEGLSATEKLTKEAAYANQAEHFIKPNAFSENLPNKGYTTYARSKPDISAPVAEQATRGRVPGLLQEQPEIPRMQVPGVQLPEFPNVNMLQAEKNISSDPESMVAMLAAKRSDNARRAANIRHHGEPEPPRPMTATDKADFADDFRDKLMSKKGKITDGKGNVSARSVTQIIQDIRDGNLLRFAQTPESATGTARNIAVEQADTFVTNKLIPSSGNKRIDLNPANQANLYNRMYNATETVIKSDPKLKKLLVDKKTGAIRTTSEAGVVRRKLARGMLRTAEDHMIRLGKHPVFWNGMRVRLSDVLEDVGINANEELATRVMNAFVTKDMRSIKEPEVAAAINRALGRRALSNSDLIENLSSYTARAKKNIIENYSYPKAKAALDGIPDAAAESAKKMGMTNEEAMAVRDMARNIIDIDKIPAEKMMEEIGPALIKAVGDKRATAETIAKFNRSVAKTIGETPAKLAKDVSGDKIVDSVMVRFATWYGRGEMKKYSQDVFNWKEENAGARAAWLRDKVKNYSHDEIHRAFKVAQFPHLADTISPKEQKLVDQFNDYFDTMLGSSGFRDIKDMQNTVAVKSAMTMEDVNKHLKAVGSSFQFRADNRAKNILGQSRDYSEKGVGWMKYWENADSKKTGQDPVSFMFDLDLAMERTMAEYTLYDDFAMRFGARKGDAAFDPKVHTEQIVHNRMDGYYFPKKERDEFIRLVHDNEEGIWRPNSKPMRFYSRGLRAWKTGVTIYLPSHHIRNLIGDTWLMWAAGHSDPRDFIRARRIMHSQRSRYKDALHQDSLDQLKGLVDKDAMEWAKTNGTDVIIKRNGTQVTAEQLYIAAHQHGLLLDANKLEDIFGETPLGNVMGANGKLQQILRQPLGGYAHHAAATTAEYREHFIRLAHFSAAVNKGLKKSKNLAKIFDDAAHEVRKWHPDGRDLTVTEQKLRMLVPFYSWTRKAIPLAIQTAVQRPSRVLYYPRANYAMQGMMGIESEGVIDPFPDNQLFPNWIRAMGVGPIGDPESDNPVSAWWGRLGTNTIGMFGQPTGYTIVNPSNPFQDLVSQFTGMGDTEGVLSGMRDSLSPAVGVPMDLMKNKTFSGAPIYGDEPGAQGTEKYLTDQVPIASVINRVVDAGKKKRPGVESGLDIEALINILTAAGVRGTGPYQKGAEFEAKNR